MGAPTKYNPVTVFPRVEEYITSCGREQTSLPTIEGLANALDVTSETIRQWVKEYPNFSSTIKKMTDKQKQQLMEDGMYGGKEVNAAMAIFLLKCNHGMNDGTSTNVNIDAKILVLPSEVITKYEITSNASDSNK